MNHDEELMAALADAGFPPAVITEHLPKFRRLVTEIKAGQMKFWGDYFIRTGHHYLEQEARRAK